jgi:hypothetical protein
MPKYTEEEARKFVENLWEWAKTRSEKEQGMLERILAMAGGSFKDLEDKDTDLVAVKTKLAEALKVGPNVAEREMFRASVIESWPHPA